MKYLEKLYLRSIFFYISHSFRVRGFWPSVQLWSSEIRFCIREKDWYFLSRPFLDQAGNACDVDDNPFQATYYVIAREALEFVRSHEGSGSLYDVGAGNGRVAKVALALGFREVMGIEVDVRWQVTLRALEEQSGGRFNFIIGDALETVPRQRFDTIVMFNPMSHGKFQRFLANMEREGWLPGIFVLINPEYDTHLFESGYEEICTSSTGQHVEYKIFKRRKR